MAAWRGGSVQPTHDIDTGSSRFVVLFTLCAALAGAWGCAKTNQSEDPVDSGGGGGQAAGGSAAGGAGGAGSGGGGAAGVDAAAGNGNGFGGFIPDAGPSGDAGPPEVEEQSICGDGKLTAGEECDDKNIAGGDGCSPSCQQEADFACPAPGEKCVSTVKCNDRKVNGNEQCDDGNNTAGDGCSPTCTLECGWTCTVGGGCRADKCGD